MRALLYPRPYHLLEHADLSAYIGSLSFAYLARKRSFFTGVSGASMTWPRSG